MSYMSRVLANPTLASHWKLDGDPIAAITASSSYSANPPSGAHDGNLTNPWITNATQAGWLQYELNAAFAVTNYKIVGGAAPTRNPKDWTFEGSNNGSTWTVLDTRTAQSWSAIGATNSYDVANSTAYKFYRLNVSANSGDTYLAVAELIFQFPDSSGNNRGASMVGIPTSAPAAGVGLTGSAITVSGGVGAAVDPGAAGFLAGQASFSVNMWFKTTTAGTLSLLSTSNQSYGGADPRNHMLLRMVDGSLQVYVGTPSGYASTTTAATYANGAWHMVTATVGAGTISLYVDGALKNSTTYAGSPNAGTGTMLRIGASNVGSNTVDSPWVGSLDEVSTYQSVLSATEIAALYTDATTAAATPLALTAPKATASASAPAPVAKMSLALTAPKATASALALAASVAIGAAPLNLSAPKATVSVAAPAASAVVGPFNLTVPKATASASAPAASFTFGALSLTAPKASASALAQPASLNVAGSAITLTAPKVTALAVAYAPTTTIPLTLPSWDIDDSGQTTLGLGTSGELDAMPPLALPPEGYVERPLVRRSVVVPAMHTISGRIVDPVTGGIRIPDDVYDALAVTTEEIGVPHIIFPNWGDLNDVTYFRGGIIRIGNMRMEEPFGDVTLDFEIPLLTSMDHEPDAANTSDPLYWTMNRANVEIVLAHPDATITRLWAGHVVSHDIGNDQSGPFRRFTAVGSLRQAATDVLKVPNMLDPTDIGTLIPRALNGVASRRYPKIGWVSTGIMSRQRGSWSDSPLGYTQSLLSTSFTPAGNQWTVSKVEGTRRTYELRPKDTAVSLTVTNGARGVEVDLTRDATSTRNVIYGHGVADNGYAWWNYKYPNLHGDTAPLYPGSLMGLGASGAGVTSWQQRVRDLGYSIAVDGTISSSDVEIIRTVQRRYGLSVDGVIGPQTWAATFDVGGNGGDLSGVIRLPLAADPRTQPFLYNADGSVAGDNPAFDSNVIIYADDVDFGSGITRAEGILSAQQILDREAEPGLTGRIVLRSDPREMSRFLIRPGRKLRLVGFEQADRVLHITAVDVDWQSLSVTLEVDEKSRDAMTVAQIRERDKEARRDPARRPGNVNRRSRLDVDQVVPFDGESGAGRVPKFATYGGLWSVIRVPVSETGRVAMIDMQTSGPQSELFVAMFGAPIQPAHLVKYVGNPASSSARWEQNRAVLEDQFGWIEAFGSADEPGGYWPGLKSNSSPLTGRLKDTGGFEYVSAKPPWIWVAVFTPTSSYVQGRILPAPVI